MNRYIPVLLLVLAIPISMIAQKAGLQPERKTPNEIPWTQSKANLPGSGTEPGIDTIYVAGDGTQKELYSMMFRIQPHTSIQPHSHPDDRSCFVLSGLWYFGYGNTRNEEGLKELPPGSHYNEPAGIAHFAGTKDKATVLECTAVGPTGTTFVNPSDDPRNKH